VLSEDEALEVLDVYMSVYILGFLADTATPQELHQNILELYPSWPSTQQFIREVYRSIAPKRNYLYFKELEHAIEEIGNRYGRFQDGECREFKDTLMAVEDHGVGGAGRVRVADFYGLALNKGKWQYSESFKYLRQLGCLDESDPANPRVIIPNYIASPSNCVASSAYYSVCCTNECESILGRFEKLLAAPEAPASQIIDIVPMVSSPTVPRNRTLATWLRQRLIEIANYHDGVVPLHGRLFAQWLHYAYPRECIFPHVNGATNPVRPEDLLRGNVTEEDIAVNETQMPAIIAAWPAMTKRRIPGAEAGAKEESGMWSMEEELVVERPERDDGILSSVSSLLFF
jgi:hypothetical protein